MNSVVVNVPADFNLRFPAVFEAGGMLNDPDTKRFSLCLPADNLPLDLQEILGGTFHGKWKSAIWDKDGVRYVSAKSLIRPQIIPLEATSADLTAWSLLLRMCRDTNTPPELLLEGRPLRVLVTPWEYNRQGVEGVALGLDAIQILDLAEGRVREALDRIRARLEDNELAQAMIEGVHE